MPRMKVDEIDNLEDLDELEEAEYDDSDRGGSYDGEAPPPKIILNGYIKRMWFTYTDPDSGKPTAGRPMFVNMFVADGNVGDYEQYNGWATWDYIVIAKLTKFRWQPFCTAIGLPIKYVLANIDYEDEEDLKGWPVNFIGPKSKPKFIPGEDEDSAYLRILTKHEKDKRPRSEGGTGQYQTKIDKYLEWDEPEAPEAEPDEVEEEEAPPTRTTRTRSTARTASSAAKRKAPEPEPDEDEYEDEEGAVDEGGDEAYDDEPEDVPPTPATRRRAARTPAKPAAAKAPATTRTRQPAARTRQPAASAAKPAARGRGGKAASGSTEEPPF